MRKRRIGRRQRNEVGAGSSQSFNNKSIPVIGGSFKPLSPSDLDKIHKAAVKLLAQTGIAAAPTKAITLVKDAGGKFDSDKQRLLFPEALLEETLANLKRNFTLYGRDSKSSLHLYKHRVHLGTGGAAPHMLDFSTRNYRESNLQDLFAAARIVDSLDHFHFFSRPVVARDISDQLCLDINTAYASLLGTSKHVLVSAGSNNSVREIAALCYQIAGSEQAFRDFPFLSLNINHVTPPMRFDTDACEVLIAAAEHGLPIMVNTFGQLGASSPVTIAGCIAQTIAETLAGMIIAYLASADAKAVFGPRPMITDLRSGAMSGGSGEQALLTAAAVQMAQYYELPNSTIAGATDSKMPDAQSGYEKCLTVNLAVQAGSNLITQAGGTQASLMGLSFESLVIDNDMLGSILRAAASIEICPETLSADDIASVATTAGHFLGESQTYARMNSDFLYPEIADRRSIASWEASECRNLLSRAHCKVQDILKSPIQPKIESSVDSVLRRKFDIKLPPVS